MPKCPQFRSRAGESPLTGDYGSGRRLQNRKQPGGVISGANRAGFSILSFGRAAHSSVPEPQTPAV
jgi:hypothetical protein